MADLTQSLLFIKGLRENPEYVDENWIRNLINIWREVWNGDLEERVIIGTDFADGAFSSLKALLEDRRDIFEKWNKILLIYTKVTRKIILNHQRESFWMNSASFRNEIKLFFNNGIKLNLISGQLMPTLLHIAAMKRQ